MTAVRVTRAERVAQVAPLRAEGLIAAEIAARIGLARSTVADLINDPSGEKNRARKLSYGGTCERCGTATCGSDGRAKAPTMCASCRADQQHEDRRWTREAVIDAIQRFAVEHGRPPSSNEWIRTDPENDYPAASTVYSHPRSPFRFWADAIEAAGFERPTVGCKIVIYGQGRSFMDRTYMVLHRNGNGWEIFDESVPAHSADQAIERVVREEGEYAAVLSTQIVVREVKVQTRLGIVRS